MTIYVAESINSQIVFYESNIDNESLALCQFEDTYHDYDSGQLNTFQCQEEPLESGLCIFHDKGFLQNKTNREIHKKEVLKKLKNKITHSISSDEKLVCIGYYLPGFDFLDLGIGKEFTNPVYFRLAHFYEDVIFYGATFQGEADFSHVTFEGNANFGRAHFLKETNFYAAEFHGWGGFYDAKFQQKALFSVASFKEASFNKALLMGETYFPGATFHGKAHFREANFGNSDFSSAAFKGEAVFMSSRFNEDAIFTAANFQGLSVFEGADFKEKADFSIANFELMASFIRVSFQREAYFGATFQKEAFFIGANFQGNARFTRSNFKGRADFSQTKFQLEVDFSEAKFQEDTYFIENVFNKETLLNRVLFVQQNKTVFNKNDLSSVSFADSDITRIRFGDQITWAKDGFSIVEEEWLRQKTAGLEPAVDVSLNLVLSVYRNLRENYEFRLRYDEAGKLFIKEMELKRKYGTVGNKSVKGSEVKENNWFRKHFSLTGLYYHFSTYGESIVKPTIIAGITVGLSTLFWLIQNNPTLEPSLSFLANNSSGFSNTSNFINISRLEAWNNSTHLLKAFERSIADFIPLLTLPSGIKVGVIDYIIKIVGGALTFGLLIIAFRRKFERKYTR